MQNWSASAIKCWVCNSRDHRGCEDPFLGENIKHLQQECPHAESGTRACVKAKVECNYVYIYIFCVNLWQKCWEFSFLTLLCVLFHLFVSNGYDLSYVFKWNGIENRQFCQCFVHVRTCTNRWRYETYWFQCGYLWGLYWWWRLQWSFEIRTDRSDDCHSVGDYENFIVLKFEILCGLEL